MILCLAVLVQYVCDGQNDGRSLNDSIYHTNIALCDNLYLIIGCFDRCLTECEFVMLVHHGVPAQANSAHEPWLLAILSQNTAVQCGLDPATQISSTPNYIA